MLPMCCTSLSVYNRGGQTGDPETISGSPRVDLESWFLLPQVSCKQCRRTQISRFSTKGKEKSSVHRYLNMSNWHQNILFVITKVSKIRLRHQSSFFIFKKYDDIKRPDNSLSTYSNWTKRIKISSKSVYLDIHFLKFACGTCSLILFFESGLK